MKKKIAVWNTFCEAINFFKNNILIFAKGMPVPLVVFIACALMQIPTFGETPNPSLLALADLCSYLQTFTAIWIGNVCYRITVTGMSGKLWWSMAETWTVMAMIIVSIIILIGAGIPGSIVYFSLSALNSPLMLSYMATGFVSLSITLYLIARFTLLFPDIAVNETINIKRALQMTRKNTGRLLILIMLPLFTIGVAVALLAGILSLVLGQHGTFMVSFIFAQVCSIFIFCLDAVVLATAYKQLNR